MTFVVDVVRIITRSNMHRHFDYKQNFVRFFLVLCCSFFCYCAAANGFYLFQPLACMKARLLLVFPTSSLILFRRHAPVFFCPLRKKVIAVLWIKRFSFFCFWGEEAFNIEPSFLLLFSLIFNQNRICCRKCFGFLFSGKFSSSLEK